MPYFVEFPVSFAENKVDESSEFYVEWLDNSEEFPSLPTSNDWELLKRKELSDDISLVSVEEDWSAVDGETKPYSKIVQDVVRPQQSLRRVEYLWPEDEYKKPSNAFNMMMYCELPYDMIVHEDDCLLSIEGPDIQIQHKKINRKPIHQTKKHLLRKLKTVDHHYACTLQIATSKKSWQPRSKIDESTISETYIDTKAQALSFTSRFTHNVKKYVPKAPKKTANTKFKSLDDREYSVCNPIVN